MLLTMPRIARALADNQIYHIVNRGNRREKGDRQLFFIIPPVPKLELGNEETLRKIKKERQFEH